eukprot:5731834-Pyramimonas_sp.AAC.2
MAAAKGSRVDVTLFDSSITSGEEEDSQKSKGWNNRIFACFGRFRRTSSSKNRVANCFAVKEGTCQLNPEGHIAGLRVCTCCISP